MSCSTLCVAIGKNCDSCSADLNIGIYFVLFTQATNSTLELQNQSHL